MNKYPSSNADRDLSLNHTKFNQFLQILTPYLFLFPALTFLILTVFYPAFQAFYLSFTRYENNLTEIPVWVGWDNFQRLWSDPIFWKTLQNTLLYLIGVVPILVIFPLILAILVNQKLKGISWFRAAFYTPVIISMVVAGIAWKGLYDSNGLFNQIIQQLHLTFFLPSDWGDKIPWLTNQNVAIWSVMLVTIWKGLGFYMVIYLAGLQGISPELYEAASIDGTDGWKKHFDITFPLMKPYLFLVAVISSISATKVFDEVYIMTQGGPNNASKTVVLYIYEEAFQYLNISYACAIGLVLFLGILGLSLLNLHLSYRS
jgi:putative chitobiose transport system permease protein